MQGALERSHDNQYHLYNVDGFANHITEGAKVVSPLRSHCQQHLHWKTAASGSIANMAAAWRCCAEHKARWQGQCSASAVEICACVICSRDWHWDVPIHAACMGFCIRCSNACQLRIALIHCWHSKHLESERWSLVGVQGGVHSGIRSSLRYNQPA